MKGPIPVEELQRLLGLPDGAEKAALAHRLFGPRGADVLGLLEMQKTIKSPKLRQNPYGFGESIDECCK